MNSCWLVLMPSRREAGITTSKSNGPSRGSSTVRAQQQALKLTAPLATQLTTSTSTGSTGAHSSSAVQGQEQALKAIALTMRVAGAMQPRRMRLVGSTSSSTVQGQEQVLRTTALNHNVVLGRRSTRAGF
jgi:hypothetical protein